VPVRGGAGKSCFGGGFGRAVQFFRAKACPAFRREARKRERTGHFYEENRKPGTEGALPFLVSLVSCLSRPPRRHLRPAARREPGSGAVNRCSAIRRLWLPHRNRPAALLLLLLVLVLGMDRLRARARARAGELRTDSPARLERLPVRGEQDDHVRLAGGP